MAVLRRTVELVPLIAPQIILLVLLWTCSIRADCSSVMLLIRTSPYSKSGRMKDFYINSKVLQWRQYIRHASISSYMTVQCKITGENNTEIFVCFYLLHNRSSEYYWRWCILSLFNETSLHTSDILINRVSGIVIRVTALRNIWGLMLFILLIYIFCYIHVNWYFM